MGPRWGSIPRLTDWLTVSRNVARDSVQADIHLSVSVVRSEILVAGAGDSSGTQRMSTVESLYQATASEDRDWEHYLVCMIYEV
jgi:hypothetical protein